MTQIHLPIGASFFKQILYISTASKSTSKGTTQKCHVKSFQCTVCNFFGLYCLGDFHHSAVPLLACAKVLPPIPLLSSSADAMFYALQFHPSYTALHTLTNGLMHTGSLPAFQFHEVDGAYANERLNAHYLSIPGFDGSSGGFFFEHSRCQNHSTHLITIAVLNLVGCNMLSKLYQLTVFLSNLGFVLRLQIAVKDWLLDKMVLDSKCNLSALVPDPLMTEVRNYIDLWHSCEDEKRKADSIPPRGNESSQGKSQFERKLQAFSDMWNHSAAGFPQHNCDCGLVSEGRAHCRDRKEAADKMAKVLIDLLLTACPSPPAPNKWTKLWRPVRNLLRLEFC